MLALLMVARGYQGSFRFPALVPSTGPGRAGSAARSSFLSLRVLLVKIAVEAVAAETAEGDDVVAVMMALLLLLGKTSEAHELVHLEWR